MGNETSIEGLKNTNLNNFSPNTLENIKCQGCKGNYKVGPNPNHKWRKDIEFI